MTEQQASELATKLEQRAAEGGRILLKLRRKSPPRGQRLRLLGRSGPLGRFVSWVEGEWYLVDFDAREVLAFLEGRSK